MIDDKENSAKAAVQTLVRLLDCGDHGIELAAAQAILANAMQLREYGLHEIQIGLKKKENP